MSISPRSDTASGSPAWLRDGARGRVRGVDPGLLPPIARLPLRSPTDRRGQNQGSQGPLAGNDRLGPSYVKLGQFLATRPDIVGTKVARELEAFRTA